jgi:hypothetical protein
MKFLISFIRIDTTFPDKFWPNSEAISGICHEYVNTKKPEYQDCSNSQEIEAKFESLNNYADDGEGLKQPHMKLKVLRVESLSSAMC